MKIDLLNKLRHYQLNYIKRELGYRKPSHVRNYRHTQDGIFFICPTCKNTIEREYVRYCCCCGQRLYWFDDDYD